MPDFPSAVSAPSPASYSAPLLSFQQFANWAADDPYQRIFNQQQQTLNEQRLTQGQMAVDASRAIAGGDFRTKDGGIDYSKLVQTMLKFGDVNGLQQLAPLMLQQQAAGTPLVPADGSAPTGAPAPQPAAARPSSAAPAGAPRGDQADSIMSRVTDAMPPGSDKIGVVAANIAKSMGGLDPNVALTPEQAKIADQRIAMTAKGGNGTASPAQRVEGSFAALPPSANAGTPAPAPAAPAAAQPAPNGAPSAAPIAALPINPFTNRPIASAQEGQNVVAAINNRISQLSANPNNATKIHTLENVRSQIQEAIKPVDVNVNSTKIDPVSRGIIYQGPAAAAIEASAHASSSPTLDADAERYLQTGTLPPNLAKNLMGQAEAKAIRDRAAAMAQERGINTAELPQKWQQFKAQQVAIQRFTSGPQGNTIRSFNVLVDHLDTLNEAAAALKNGDMRLFNRVANTWATNTGATAPTDFNAVKALVGDEIVKAIVGSAGALADREEVKRDLNDASSPKQLASIVKKYKMLALGQLHGLQKQYETSTGLKNFGELLLPQTLKQLGGAKEGDKGTPAEAKPKGSVNVGGKAVGWSIVE